MKMYTALFRIRFVNTLQYRAAALAGVTTQFAWGFMLILTFRVFYRENPAAFPMEFSHMVSYIWMQQAFIALFMTWFWEDDIADSITSGAIAYELVRPLDLYNRWFCQCTANRVSRATLRCIAIFLVVFLLPEPFRMSLPPSFAQFALFLLSAVLALGVVVAFCMLVYTSLFYTMSPLGIRIISAMLGEFLQGAIIPLPFFPAPIRVIVELLPFAAMQNMPLRIYSGDIAGSDALRGMILQVFWLIMLFAVGRVAMRRALKKVIVQGG
ncbi:MAG: ABC transporter permease [Oscillospiraceae bacterium]|nr:ABC transporter permease [Oscillospiraceae bacterium]